MKPEASPGRAAELEERLEEEAAFARLAAQRRAAHALADPEEEYGDIAPAVASAPPSEPPPAPGRKVRARHGGGRVGRHHKLHRGHFALMRGYVQGLDLGEMWDRYMAIEGAATDIRSVRRSLRLLREDLGAAAQRYAGPYLARCMAAIDVDIHSLAAVTPARLPSLEDFVFDRGLDGEREAEQIRLYHEAYGAPSAQQQRHALQLKHRLSALRILEQLAAEKPHADDAVAAWLRPELAEPLQAVDVQTLRQLVDRINGLGYGWAAGLQAIGATKAQRIVAWLRQPDNDIGVPVGDHALVPRSALTPEAARAIVAPATAVVPIEKFIVPPELDGRQGMFRGPKPCMLTADTDFDAMLAYIRSKPGLPPEDIAGLRERDLARGAGPGQDHPLAWLRYLTKTQAGYLAEIYRFMLWSIIERKKATSSINIEDAVAYRDFLADPQPSDTWCSGARGREKILPSWRPFVGPLAPSMAEKVLKILSGWYNYLHRAGYQTANPFNGIKPIAQKAAAIADDRSFTLDQWAYISGQLAALVPTSANLRLRFGVRFMYMTGARSAEAVAAKVEHLRWVSYPPTVDDPGTVEGWLLGIVGKGNKARMVPVPDVLIADLIDYLASRGLQANLHAPENKAANLLGHAVDVAERAPWAPAAQGNVDRLAGIGAQTWYDALKTFFKECGANLASSDPESAAQFDRASSHFLRHSRISHSLEAGTSIQVERELAGHADLFTTSQYSHASSKKLMRGAQQFFRQLSE